MPSLELSRRVKFRGEAPLFGQLTLKTQPSGELDF